MQSLFVKDATESNSVANRRMRRYLDAQIRSDLAKKMVFLVGARQVGKTTLSRALLA
jgi:ATP-dependent protease HslVU (ClpYQ) ATPase subunit